MTDQRRKRPRDPAQLAKFVIDIATGEVEDRPPTPAELGRDPAAVALGSKGGKARAKKLTVKQRREIATNAANARWRNDR